MDERILFVDDDTNILDGYKRQLRKQFLIETAEGAEKGLDAVKNRGPFAVIVSDLKMPGMDGNNFLSQIKKISPETTRILLTGYADLTSAMSAINNGNIFRLLTKPCDKKDLVLALEDGIEHYRENLRTKSGKESSGFASKKKVLIADDDPVTLRLLKKALKDIENLEVYTAPDGKKAIGILNREPVDLLVSDIYMPEVNGLQLINYASKNDKSLKVIVLTGRGSDELENRVRSIGNFRYYEKPLDINVFKESVIGELQSINNGQIHGINISSFLQLIDIEGKVCTLTVRSKGNTGYLFFQDGVLIAARTGDESGEQAAFKIINWDDSVIEINEACKMNKREISKSLMQILMESARLKDEEQSAAEN